MNKNAIIGLWVSEGKSQVISLELDVDINSITQDVLIQKINEQLDVHTLFLETKEKGQHAELFLFLGTKESEKFFTLPTSATSNSITELLAAGKKGIPKLPARKKKVNHSSAMEVSPPKGKSRRITIENQTDQIAIEFKDFEELTSNNPAKKLFALALIKANKQVLHDGQLQGRIEVSFPLQELVDLGLYTNTDNARRGFKAGMRTLTHLTIEGKVRHKVKKKEILIEGGRVLFTSWDIIKGQCYIRLNPDMDWDCIAQYYTILPPYYFRLSNRAGDLLYYIFYMARQNIDEIAKRGYFTISFRTIWERLNLPRETDNKNPYITIKKPIEDAITEIEEMHRAFYGNTDFKLLPVCGDLADYTAASITTFLDNGYLQVGMTGDFAEPFIERSEKSAKQIETAQKKKDRIVEQAKIKNMAKKLEREESSGTK